MLSWPLPLNAKTGWDGQLVKHVPSAQVMILLSWDQALHQAPSSSGSLLLPLVPPACVSSLRYVSLCQINK